MSVFCTHPLRIQGFRDSTNKQGMAGVTNMTFRCACCGKNKRMAGRKKSTGSRYGYDCADCVAERTQ